MSAWRDIMSIIMPLLKKALLSLIRIFVAVYILFGALLFVYQRHYIYFPSKQDFNACANLPSDVEKITYEGTRMYVHKATDSWVVIYHGNAGSACDRSYYLDYFDARKYSYIIVEYAGFSNDSESPSQDAWMKNVRDADDYLKAQKAAKKIVIGESLGTALASYHSYIDRPDRLILISPFDSLEHVSQSMYWFYPIKLMLHDKYPSATWLADADHVLIIHGSDDDIVPIRFGRSLFDAISGADKTFVTVPGAGHNDIHDFNLTKESINRFFRQYF